MTQATVSAATPDDGDVIANLKKKIAIMENVESELRAELAAAETSIGAVMDKLAFLQAQPARRTKLPDTRPSVTRKVEVATFDVYIVVGFYPDTHTPGELFITVGKEGSTLGGLFDVIGVMASIALQHGVPWAAIAKKLVYTRFEPCDKDGYSIAHVIAEAVTQLIESERSAWEGT